MSNVFVTSFSPTGYEEYGRDFVTGWAKHAQADAKLLVYYEGSHPTDATCDSRIIWTDLNNDLDLKKFLDDNPEEGKQGIFTKEDGTKFYNYRFQATKFAHKIFALTQLHNIPLTDWYIWIDADVEVFDTIPNFTGDPDTLAYYIGRTAWDHSECGFVAYNAKHPRFREFLLAFRRLYMSNALFSLPEWHDSFIFDRIREAYEAEDTKFINFAAGIDHIHPWDQTFLGKWSRHNKGPLAKLDQQKRKQASVSIQEYMVGCKDRYEQIPRIISQLKPSTIVEVGTWNGDRAISMATEALKHRDKVHYIGFDLFEDATVENDAAELNVKKHHTQVEVEGKLHDLFAMATKEGKTFTYQTHRGNTRDTIKAVRDTDIDFAFIDGGHSLDTIRNDYNGVKHAKLVLLDDYYMAGADTTKFGCNELLKDIPHIVLPTIDKFSNRLHIAQALVGKGLVINGQTTPGGIKEGEKLDIRTKNCVDNTEIHDNIRYSDRFTERGLTNKIAQLEAELTKLQTVTKVAELPPACFVQPALQAHLVGGAPSWKEHIHHAEGQRVFVTKSSHDDVIAMGIVPFGCILLDPRDHVESCIANFHPETIYFVASMCHPSTWDRLITAGVKVVRFHAGVHAEEEKVIAELGGGNIVFGGTTAGMRGMNVLYMMGYRHFELYGFDSSYETKPDKHHGRSPKPVIEVDVHGRRFITDPELVAQSKDIEVFLKMMPDASVKVHGDGMLAWAAALIEKVDKGANNRVPPALAPYQNALGLQDELQEAFWIDNAIHALRARRRKVIHHKANLQTFEDFLSNSVNR